MHPLLLLFVVQVFFYQYDITLCNGKFYTGSNTLFDNTIIISKSTCTATTTLEPTSPTTVPPTTLQPTIVTPYIILLKYLI